MTCPTASLPHGWNSLRVPTTYSYLFSRITVILKVSCAGKAGVLDAFYSGMRILGEFSAGLIYHPLSRLVCVAEWKLFTRWSQFIAVRCPRGTCLSEWCAKHPVNFRNRFFMLGRRSSYAIQNSWFWKCNLFYSW